MWINKCRGTVRFGMGDAINIVIVEMHRLKNMIEAYSQWFQRNVEMYRKQGTGAKVSTGEPKSVVVIQCKNKREQMLLGSTH